MSDYDKLTVVKLRDELVKRGLPKTGLKAALVQRLQDADAQSGDTNTASTGPITEAPDAHVQNQNPALPEKAVPAHPTEVVERKDTDLEIGAEKEPKSNSDGDADGSQKDVAGGQVVATEGSLEQDIQTRHDEQTPPPQSSSDLPVPAPLPDTPALDSQKQQDTQSEVLPGVLTQPIQDPEPITQLPTPLQTQSENNTMTPPAGTEELLDDSKKRKRRSQSPPPSSIDTQKRLKSETAMPYVRLPEDSTMDDSPSERQSDGNASPAIKVVSGEGTQLNGHGLTKEISVAPEQNGKMEAGEPNAMKQEHVVSSQSKSTDSPIKSLPSDSRFENLFSGQSKPENSSQELPYSDTEDRVISPALHPATSALYIRELMRPLKPESIRDHLIALATPPDTPVDKSIVTSFFLDSIRTHCLVGFANTSAASRVRSVLHDRIWPNERDRRPLYVDFVPEEKLKKWIDVEQNAPSGRGQAQKRWEVVYEDEDGAIKAYLQEVGTSSGGLQATLAAKTDAGQGVRGAPSGPRIKESEPRAIQTRNDNGKGFQALDDLFKSTTAKPKLYYQPVPKATVNQRLDRLASGRGGGGSEEMRRYTFEDEVLVDKAPEFGNRGRGGYGGRGSFSYRGRGGGYRGDSYRDSGDSWRDRRPGY